MGALSAATLLAYALELGGGISSKALVTMVALAPWVHASGGKSWRGAIRGGRGAAHKALYFPAMSVAAVVAIQQMMAFYQRLLGEGKASEGGIGGGDVQASGAVEYGADP